MSPHSMHSATVFGSPDFAFHIAKRYVMFTLCLPQITEYTIICCFLDRNMKRLKYSISS